MCCEELLSRSVLTVSVHASDVRLLYLGLRGRGGETPSEAASRRHSCRRSLTRFDLTHELPATPRPLRGASPRSPWAGAPRGRMPPRPQGGSARMTRGRRARARGARGGAPRRARRRRRRARRRGGCLAPRPPPPPGRSAPRGPAPARGLTVARRDIRVGTAPGGPRTHCSPALARALTYRRPRRARRARASRRPTRAPAGREGAAGEARMVGLPPPAAAVAARVPGRRSRPALTRGAARQRRPAARRAPRRPERSGARERPSRHRELPGSRLDIREAGAYTVATARAARGPGEARRASKTNFARDGEYAGRRNSAAPQPFPSKLAGILDQKSISLPSKFGGDWLTGRPSFCEKSTSAFRVF